jgi:hypothetical protein
MTILKLIMTILNSRLPSDGLKRVSKMNLVDGSKPAGAKALSLTWGSLADP